MNVYLVGGAVRDQLLDYPVKERDFVVVGATVEQLRALGFLQVGRDFPVFLHPTTREEYALARTERKRAPGYYGFACDANAHVTLEDDLRRRDLTINAMAMDDTGRIIDPYNGQADIKARLLRHVSPAFVEDPVRVLRVARFAARYYHVGFRVANETRELMYRMVLDQELDHLVPERVWQEWHGSLLEKNPEQFIMTLRSCGALKVILPEIDQLFGVPNPRKYHPEVDSGVHTLLALEHAARLSDDPLVRFGALLHDVGKGSTPMALWPKHYGHEDRGVACINAICQRLRVPSDYRQFAAMVSAFHLNIHRFFELRPNTVVTLLEKMDAFRRGALFDKLLTACEADAKGCGECIGAEIDYPQAAQWRLVRTACATIDAQPLIEQGYQGVGIKHALHARRVHCVKQLLGKA